MPFSPVLPIILTEQGGRARRFTFSGTDLPQRPNELAGLGGRLRTAVNYYPGSSLPTAQILGAEETSLRFAGEFDDRLRRIPGWAMRQMNLLDQIRRAGSPVLFEWGTIRRRCVWEACEFQVLESEKIAYEIALIVVDHGFGGEDRRVFRTILDIPGVDQVLEAIGEVSTIVDALPDAFGADILGDLRDKLGGVVSSVEAASGALEAIRTVGRVVSPGAASSAVTGFEAAKEGLRGAFSAARTLDFGAIPGSLFDASVGAAKSVGEALTGIVRSSGLIDGLIAKVRPLAQSAVDTQVYIATDGETLQRIALRVYGDAKAWTRIADANGKTTGAVVAGELVVLPDVPPRPKAAEVLP